MEAPHGKSTQYCGIGALEFPGPLRYRLKAMTPADRIDALRTALDERILVLDGAMGTAIQALRPRPPTTSAAPTLEGCNEHLVLTRPGRRSRTSTAATSTAGADIIETNTLRRRRRIVLAEYGLAGQGPRDQPRRGPARPRRRRTRCRRRSGRASWPARWARARRPSRSPAASRSTRSRERLRRAGDRPGRGRRRPAVPRDPAGHAATSRPPCSASTTPWRALGRRVPVVVSVSHRGDGHACSPASRSKRCTSRSRTATCFAIGLNCATGPGLHDRPPAHAGGDLALPDLVLPERRPARRRRAATTRLPAMLAAEGRALLRRGLGEPRRRLLRHHARAHPRCSPRWRHGKRRARAGDGRGAASSRASRR